MGDELLAVQPEEHVRRWVVPVLVNRHAAAAREEPALVPQLQVLAAGIPVVLRSGREPLEQAAPQARELQRLAREEPRLGQQVSSLAQWEHVRPQAERWAAKVWPLRLAHERREPLPLAVSRQARALAFLAPRAPAQPLAVPECLVVSGEPYPLRRSGSNSSAFSFRLHQTPAAGR